MKDEDRIWTLPNVLTILRIVLIPVYWVLFMNDHTIAAFCVYLAASVTDFFDGYLARKYNQITNFGKLADPVADKLMVVSILLSLVIKRIVPALPLIILAVKELLMLAGGFFMLRKNVVVYSKMIGKVAQVVLICALVLCFFTKQTEAIGLSFIHLYVLWLGVVLAICALIYYAKDAYQQLKEQRKVE